MNTPGCNILPPGERIRRFRLEQKKSLDWLAKEIAGITGGATPSKAKISRLETGEQPIPLDVIPAIEKLTGIPAAELRPDLAAIFETQGAE